MTRTITEAEALTLAVRGDVPGVLDGYVGPARWGQASALWAYVGMIQDCHYAASGDDGRHDAYVGRDCLGDTHQGLFLPLARPEVQAHLVDWLGRGERCRPCRGTGRIDDDAGYPRACVACGGGEMTDGHGYLRAPHNRYPWLTPADHGGLPDWIRMALIWGSVVRVAAGMGPIGTVLEPWVHGAKATLAPPVAWPANMGLDFYASRRVAYCPDARVGDITVLPWNSDAEDRYWLSIGRALIDTTPAGRVIRFEVPDAP